jgi:hypothetical protein
MASYYDYNDDDTGDVVYVATDPTAIHSTDSGTDQRISTIHVTGDGEIKVTY